MKSNQKIIFGIIMVALLFNSGVVFADENPVAGIGQGLVGNVMNQALGGISKELFGNCRGSNW